MKADRGNPPGAPLASLAPLPLPTSGPRPRATAWGVPAMPEMRHARVTYKRIIHFFNLDGVQQSSVGRSPFHPSHSSPQPRPISGTAIFTFSLSS